MADVIEVVHQITYQVDDRALLNAQHAIRLQIVELNVLNKALFDIQRQIERTGKNEVEALNALSRQLDTVINKLANEAGKTKGLMEQMGDGLLKAAGAGEGLSGIVQNFVTPFIEGIPSLLKGTATISELAAGVFSFSNVITAAIAGLALFLSSMSDAEEQTNDYGESLRKAAEFSKALGEESAGEMTKLISLRTTVEDVTLSYSKRLQAAKELQNLYPQYFGNLSYEEILAGKVAGAYNKVTAAIIASAKARVLQKQLEAVFEKLIPIEEKIKELAKQKGINLKVNIDDSGLNELSLSVKDVESTIRSRYKYDELQGSYDFNKKNNDKFGQIQGQLLLYKPLFEEAKALIGLLKNNNKNVPATSNNTGTFVSQSPGKVKSVDNTSPITEISPLNKKELPVNIERPKAEPIDINAKMEQYQLEQEEKAAQGKRKERITEMIAEYQNFATEAIKAINAVYDAQIKTLDKEIALRKERVSQAEKLAQRGNTEVLRLETEQLGKAQAEREKKARQQMQLNALLQASNQAVALSEAIGAIVSAAAKGDPYTIALRVAAAVAALVAGIASLSGAFSNANNFADGVVGFKGKGGPRDDANWVRISSGESVITAEGTKNNRQLLEAINNGAQLQMINPALAYTMPVFANPQVSTQGYASAYDLKVVESKLDNVVNAIEDNRLKQNIYFNEHGVGIMTERAIRKDRKRWM